MVASRAAPLSERSALACSEIWPINSRACVSFPSNSKCRSRSACSCFADTCEKNSSRAPDWSCSISDLPLGEKFFGACGVLAVRLFGGAQNLFARLIGRSGCRFLGVAIQLRAQFAQKRAIRRGIRLRRGSFASWPWAQMGTRTHSNLGSVIRASIKTWWFTAAVFCLECASGRSRDSASEGSGECAACSWRVQFAGGFSSSQTLPGLSSSTAIWKKSRMEWGRCTQATLARKCARCSAPVRVCGAVALLRQIQGDPGISRQMMFGGVPAAVQVEREGSAAFFERLAQKIDAAHGHGSDSRMRSLRRRSALGWFESTAAPVSLEVARRRA